MIKPVLLFFIILLSGCASNQVVTKFDRETDLGIRAYERSNPELAVALLMPGFRAYLSQDAGDYLSNSNLTDERFEDVVDYLIVSSWESGDHELHAQLLKEYGASLHSTFKNKGKSISNYGRVRIKQMWTCVKLEGGKDTLLEAARCWRSVGGKDRSMDNFKAHYIYQGMGRQKLL